MGAMLERTCGGCGQAVRTENVVVSPKGEAFHQRCWGVQPQKTLRESDPLCPICLQPIKLSDMVTGRQDGLMHVECDYTRR